MTSVRRVAMMMKGAWLSFTVRDKLTCTQARAKLTTESISMLMETLDGLATHVPMALMDTCPEPIEAHHTQHPKLKL